MIISKHPPSDPAAVCSWTSGCQAGSYDKGKQGEGGRRKSLCRRTATQVTLPLSSSGSTPWLWREDVALTLMISGVVAAASSTCTFWGGQRTGGDKAEGVVEETGVTPPGLPGLGSRPQPDQRGAPRCLTPSPCPDRGTRGHRNEAPGHPIRFSCRGYQRCPGSHAEPAGCSVSLELLQSAPVILPILKGDPERAEQAAYIQAPACAAWPVRLLKLRS